MIEWTDEDNAYVGSVPELPGCVTHRAMQMEAVARGDDAIVTWLQAARAWGDPIPPPTMVASPAERSRPGSKTNGSPARFFLYPLSPFPSASRSDKTCDTPSSPMLTP